MDNTISQTTIRRESVSTIPAGATTPAEETNTTISKVNQVIWYAITLIILIIAARLVLLLLGANNTSFVSYIYSLSRIFILPFTNIFASPTYGSSYLDTASIVGIIVWVILGFILTSLLNLFWKER